MRFESFVRALLVVLGEACAPGCTGTSATRVEVRGRLYERESVLDVAEFRAP